MRVGDDVANSLCANDFKEPQCVAFAQNQLGEVRTGDVFNTINTNANASGRNTPMIYYGIDEKNASLNHIGTLTGCHKGGTGERSLVAYGIEIGNQGAGGNRGYHLPDEASPTMSTKGPHGVCIEIAESPIIAFPERMSATQCASSENLSPALMAKNPTAIAMRWIVRRLTPRECERLQGFPDDYTLVPFRGKPAKDGPRYKALGNSWATVCARWLGERIQIVDEMLRERELR